MEAAANAGTLGEFFLYFIKCAHEEASTVYYQLESQAEHSHFREVRTCKQEIMPAQNDGFTTAVAIQLLRLAAGTNWQSEKVLVTVCDTSAVPERYQGVYVVGGDRMGINVRFPTAWLLNPIESKKMLLNSSDNKSRFHLPVNFRESLHQILKFNLDNSELNVEMIAKMTGLSRQTLQRRLKDMGTTLSIEIRTLRKQVADELLVSSRKSITDIASALGFKNVTSFTRAFKSWTGESPRDYRKKRRPK